MNGSDDSQTAAQRRRRRDDRLAAWADGDRGADPGAGPQHCRGQRNPDTAFLQGLVKVWGDLQLAQRATQLFGP